MNNIPSHFFHSVNCKLVNLSCFVQIFRKPFRAGHLTRNRFPHINQGTIGIQNPFLATEVCPIFASVDEQVGECQYDSM